MKQKRVFKRIGVLLLCAVMLFGNMLSVYGAGESTGTVSGNTMPDEDVWGSLEEMEVYDKGNLSDEDTALGEDVGKEHLVTTKKKYEPDVSLGKSAKWDDIEEGLATLTLTQKTTSDWADNPSDYIIVLDRTVSMTVDFTSMYGSKASDDLGFASSVCLNPNHYYKYNGQKVTLIDYGHGYYTSTKKYFTTDSFMGNKEAIWEQHYDSDGKKIAPRVYNGCIDRLTIAQNSIRDILDVLAAQNKKELAGGKKNRVMYWSFSGKSSINDGTWDEVPEFTEDISKVKGAIKYEGYPGTYYYRSFVQILQKLKEKQSDSEYKDIPTKVIFISDGLLYDENPEQISSLAKQIKAVPNTKLYTILIGNSKDSEAGKILKSYATSSAHFATVTNNWNTFVNTMTAIQKDQFEIKATDKVLTDKINTEYWEVIGEPVLEKGNGTASLDAEKTTLTWKLPEDADKTYQCQLKLKLKDQYRYLLSDTSYTTNVDAEDATEEEIEKDPSKAGAVVHYKISGGKYNTETRAVGVKSPVLKYGTVTVEGNKKWTVDGSSAESVRVSLKRTMPGAAAASEINNTITNAAKDWKYSFTVRRLSDGRTYPLIKYNNAGQKIDYEVTETVPEHYILLKKEEKEADGKLLTELYNEPYKIKVQITKTDEETKRLLSGAEFSVYCWSKTKNAYVPYKGTEDSVAGGASAVKLKEGSKGVYTTPVWLYYSQDNLGRFRVIETKAPEGYFGDWKNPTVTNGTGDKKVYDFEITKNQETIVLSNAEDGSFRNQRVKGEIYFSKLDLEGQTSKAQGEASLAGAVYKLYAAEDIVHQDGTTGVLYKKDQEIKVSAAASLNGVRVYTCDPKGTSEIKTGVFAKILIENLELGKYYLKEAEASKGYLVDPNIYEIDVLYKDEKTEIVTETAEVFESVMKQPLSFYKYTADDNSDQLDPMAGAKFSVYLVRDLDEGKYAELSDEELVQTFIDEMRNPVTLLYDIYEKYAPAMVYASEDSEDVSEGRLTKKVSYSEGKAYEAFGKNTWYVSELKSDENGVVRTPALPYGRYIVVETSTPAGKLAARPFVINVTSDSKDAVTDGDGKGTPLQEKQLTVLMDRPIKSLVRILKRDADSKKVVLKEGTSYVIHDVDGAWFDYITNEMTTAQKRAYRKNYGDLVAQYSQGTYLGTKENPFVTKAVKDAEDESAGVYIETPLALPNGTYELEEAAAPEGYVLQGHEGVIAKKESASGNGTFYETAEDGAWEDTPQGRTKFIVSNSESVYDEAAMYFITTVRQDNEPAVGKISIYAEGEKLVSAKKNKDSENYEFNYEMKPVEGAQFEIRAAQDIFSQEGGVNAEKLLEKGELVMTLTTDSKGEAWTGQEDWKGTEVAKGLPLGKYTVSQTFAGEGFYLSAENAAPVEVEISYAGQEIPVIYKNLGYESPRQAVKIEVIKTDAQSGRKLSGAVFGLYAKEDIKNFEDKTVVKANTLVASAQTTMVGGRIRNAVFSDNLPKGKYYIKELKAPEGYFASSDIYEIDASGTGQNEAESVKITLEVENTSTKIGIRKTDLLTGGFVAGAKLQVLEKDSKRLVAEWTTEACAKEITGLKLSGEEETVYILREKEPAEGYVTAEDMEFKLVREKSGGVKTFIYDSGKWKELSENVIEMKDDITRVEIRKTDKKYGTQLAGAELELRDGTGKVVASWTSEEEGFYLKRLPIGTYRIIETGKMEGYEEAGPLVIKVKDTAKRQVFTFENTPERKSGKTSAEEPEQKNPETVEAAAEPVVTGDSATAPVWAVLAAAAMIIFSLIMKKKA